MSARGVQQRPWPIIDVFGKEKNTRVLNPVLVGNLEAAKEVGNRSGTNADAGFLYEGTYLGLGDIVKGESLDRFFLKRQ